MLLRVVIPSDNHCWSLGSFTAGKNVDHTQANPVTWFVFGVQTSLRFAAIFSLYKHENFRAAKLIWHSLHNQELIELVCQPKKTPSLSIWPHRTHQTKVWVALSGLQYNNVSDRVRPSPEATKTKTCFVFVYRKRLNFETFQNSTRKYRNTY